MGRAKSYSVAGQAENYAMPAITLNYKAGARHERGYVEHLRNSGYTVTVSL
jgi:hypothetical protein